MSSLPFSQQSVHSQHGDHQHVAIAYALNGSSDYHQLPSTWGGHEHLTIEAWIKTEGPTGDFQAIVSSSDHSFVHFQIGPHGNIAAYTNTGPVILPIIPDSADKAWRHVAVIVQSGASKVIVDGAQVGATNPKKFDYVLPSDNVCIGRGYQNGRYFKGYIADLHIWYHDHGHEDLHTKLFHFHEEKPELVLVHPEVAYGFKSYHNKYMSAQPDGSIVCDRDWLRGWEKFDVEDAGDGKVGLKSAHGKYLSAQPDGSIVCDRDWLRGWEKFDIEDAGDGKVGLKSIHGKYLSAQPDGSLVCDRDWLRGWEKFTQTEAG